MIALGLFQAQSPAASFPGATLIPLVAISVLAWFLLIWPVQQQRRRQGDMRASLKPGDEVLTSGGIYGTVTKLRDGRVHVRVADGVQVEIDREHVLSTVAPANRE